MQAHPHRCASHSVSHSFSLFTPSNLFTDFYRNFECEQVRTVQFIWMDVSKCNLVKVFAVTILLGFHHHICQRSTLSFYSHTPTTGKNVSASKLNSVMLDIYKEKPMVRVIFRIYVSFSVSHFRTTRMAEVDDARRTFLTQNVHQMT